MAAVIPGKDQNQFNLAVQARRQAGSTFKTFVLDDGGVPRDQPGVDLLRLGTVHVPAVPERAGLGRVDVRPLLRRLDLDRAGDASLGQHGLRAAHDRRRPAKVAATAHRMGIQSPLKPVPSIGLGTNGVSPLEMASAYATLAAGGIYSKPEAIREVVLANGKIDEAAGWGRPSEKRGSPRASPTW